MPHFRNTSFARESRTTFFARDSSRSNVKQSSLHTHFSSLFDFTKKNHISLKKFSSWTHLPVVKSLVNKTLEDVRIAAKSLPLEDTGILYVQHSFETSLSVLDSFI